MSNSVIVAIENKVATITLNKPESANAFSDEMLDACIASIDECSSAANVIVLTGSGTAFSAGGDLKAMEKKAQDSQEEMKRSVREGPQRLARRIAQLDIPIIAAINGAATGGGMDVALMCDLRLATESARFSETYARLGLVPSPGGAFFLPRIAGVSRALDLFLTTRFIDAKEALELGIVDRVFADAEFPQCVREYAEGIAAAAPLSVRLIKRAIYDSLGQSLDQHLTYMAERLATARSSSDHREALRALREKRQPRFTGE